MSHNKVLENERLSNLMSETNYTLNPSKKVNHK